ncbi:hypothetical protein LZ575_16590 [Antarcticibacterium sp. 1MA-6-2]|nr:hypothetical protein [Antarcticibacterium sp. 1MA-6-2]UJH90432.1 hypothetical protein LZ575_16590 [Antarcticibacterium sp. 1MA-6-2]
MEVFTVLVSNYKNSTKDVGVVGKIILALVLGFIFINIILALVGVFMGQ